MKWRLLLRRRLSVRVPAKFDGNPCMVTASFSFGRGLTIRIDLDEEEGTSVLSVSPSSIQEARDQLGV